MLNQGVYFHGLDAPLSEYYIFICILSNTKLME